MKLINCIFLVLSFIPLSAQEKLDIYFDFNKSNPNSKSIQVLNDWIKQNPLAEVYMIEGYCDTVDSKIYNLKLANRRIHSVENILKINKIKIFDELERIPYGEVFDFSIHQSENRKVTFWFRNTTENKSVAHSVNLAQKNQFFELKGLNFYGGSDKILPQSFPVLEDLLQVLLKNQNLKIEIHGHICCFTNDTEEISLLRAQAVYKYLVANGIDELRLSYKGFGSSKPVYPLPEKNEEERVANRRVEILILEK
ncbi:OmpA family protein [Flavobacterium sp.]|uniref:OmpA family protein n=1 Tax=Flavobacterium sp. TaxID=239 RepID=UPI002FDB2532